MQLLSLVSVALSCFSAQVRYRTWYARNVQVQWMGIREGAGDGHGMGWKRSLLDQLHAESSLGATPRRLVSDEHGKHDRGKPIRANGREPRGLLLQRAHSAAARLRFIPASMSPTVVSRLFVLESGAQQLGYPARRSLEGKAYVCRGVQQPHKGQPAESPLPGR